MELVDSGYYFVRENGCLHVSSHTDHGCFMQYSQRPEKRKAHSDLFSGSISLDNVRRKADNNEVQPDGPASLFELCCSFIAQNITSVDSLVNFPDTVGKVIFDSILEDEILHLANDDQCARILQTFDKAYEQQLMEELKVTDHLALENHLSAVCCFHFLAKLDISGCHVGDKHDILQHIGQLKRLTHLSLQNTSISDDGLRRLSTPLRMYQQGPAKLQVLDLSYNSRITFNGSHFLRCFRCLDAVRLTGTSIKPCEAEKIAALLSMLLEKTELVNFACITNKGWAAPLADSWMTEVSSTRSQPSSSAGCVLPASSFYLKPKRLSAVSERNSSCQVIVLISSNLAAADRTSATTSSAGGRTLSGDSDVGEIRSAVVGSWDLKLNQDRTRSDHENIAQVRFKTPADGRRTREHQFTEDSERSRLEICKVYQAEPLTGGLLGNDRESPDVATVVDQSNECRSAKSTLWRAMNSGRW